MHFQRTTTRRRPRAVLTLGLALVAIFAGLLPPTTAGAAPTNAADASRLVQEAAQELTVIDEQVHEAEIAVAAQQDAAEAAAEQAAAAQAALAVFEPQLRAIAQSGYTGKSQSRMAAFLTSDSADELVQQMTTLDMIAHHTNGVVAEVAAAQAVAAQAQADADAAAATAQAGLDQLEAQQARGPEEGRRLRGDLRPADRRRAGDRHHRTRRPRAADAVPRLPAARPRPGGGDRGGHRAGQDRQPLRLGLHRPERLRLLRPDVLRLRRRRDRAAALEPGAVRAGRRGRPRRPAAR